MRSTPLATLSLLTLETWIVFELVAMDLRDADLIYFAMIGLSGCALYASGTGLAGLLDRFGFGKPMRALGYPLLAMAMFAFTFHWFEVEFREDWPASIWAMVAVAGCITLIGLLSLLVLRGRATARWEAATILASLVPLLLLIVSPPRSITGYMVAFNALLALIAIGAIVVGYSNDQLWLVAGGLVVAVVDVITRYFDFFWRMLPRSLVFVGAGLLLFAIAFLLERQRSRLFTGTAER